MSLVQMQGLGGGVDGQQQLVGGFDAALTPGNGAAGPVLTATPGGSGRSAEDKQLSQWGYHETKEFIAIRAEMEKDFVITKGSNAKTMWDLISQKMKERGYRRTPAQCKCKWKVLVNRYKGKEISDEAEKMFPPFYEELDAIFKERAKTMDRLLLESQVGGVGGEGSLQLRAKQFKGLGKGKSDDDNTEDDRGEGEGRDDGEDGDGGILTVSSKKRKLSRKEVLDRKSAQTIQEVLEQFFLQQLKLEQEWREAIERRDTERRLREREWRERMESLEKERMAREQAWRQKEEERQAREEERQRKRDQLVMDLLEKLGGTL